MCVSILDSGKKPKSLGFNLLLYSISYNPSLELLTYFVTIIVLPALSLITLFLINWDVETVQIGSLSLPVTFTNCLLIGLSVL